MVSELQNIIKNDLPMNKEIMIEQILMEIAQTLTSSMVPLRDTF